ncbi:MAG: Cys-tRNA(Pro) deacylase [Ruminococcaceae bacterium]|nr:Cys-tRNA(Pro) deacylase [Oscillospiraceae bacterium]
MADKTPKTNAMRILEKGKISFQVLTYEVDESDLSGEHIADQLNMDPTMLFKTLVLKGDKKGHLVACIPVAETVDLKALARVSGNKSVEMVQVKELFGLTGYIRGGCSPIGMKKKFPIYMHESIMNHDLVGVSGGLRGIQLLLKPEDLVKSADGELADLILKS